MIEVGSKVRSRVGEGVVISTKRPDRAIVKYHDTQLEHRFDELEEIGGTPRTIPDN